MLHSYCKIEDAELDACYQERKQLIQKRREAFGNLKKASGGQTIQSAFQSKSHLTEKTNHSFGKYKAKTLLSK